MNLNNLIITPEFLKLVSEIDEFKGSWRTLKTLNPERLESLKRIATIESVGSSTRIEGVKLSDREIEKLLEGLSSKSFSSRDEQEVAGYAEAMDTVYQSFNSIIFSENYIKQLHNIILRHSDKDEWHRGEYKKFSNSVEAFDNSGKSLGIIFKTSTPFETPAKMQEMVVWTREALEDKSFHPLIVVLNTIRTIV